jgi:thiamine biosynthesis lipoprotein
VADSRHQPKRYKRLFEVLSITGKSIATSGDYQNFFTPDYKYNHIIDPSTGVSPPELSSVTVIAPDTIAADALTKACFVMGREEGLRFIETIPDTEALFIDKQLNGYRTGGFPGAIS